jgi:flagellar hook-associated protein 2
MEAGAPATGATTLAALGAAAGDTFGITGTTGDGKSFSASIVVGDPATETLESLRAQIESKFDAAGQDVSVAIADGRIVVTDSVSGDSRLAFSIAAGLANGTIDFGGTTTTLGRKAELTQGADATLVVDGTELTRSSNVVADAIGGVTLTLQQAEVGTAVSVDIARDLEPAIGAVQAFAKAYNELVAFAEKETSASGRLAFDGTLRQSVASFRTLLLTDVAGLADGATFRRASPVGVALSKTGTLDVDANALRTALQTDLAGVQALFGTMGTSSSGQVEFVEGGTATQPGRYDVRITRAATVSSTIAAGSTLGGGYVDPTGTHRMSVTDAASGRTASIALAAGDDADAVAWKLNAVFASERMRLGATVEGGQLRISSLDHGSAPSFTVAYEDGATGSAAAQVGIAAATYQNGVDVEGSITVSGEAIPVAATGRGRVLTGATGTPMEGLQLRYMGTDDAPATSTVDYSLGLGGAMVRAAAQVTATDGFLSAQSLQSDLQIQRLTKRSEDAQARIETRRAALLRQFAAMEAALSRITAQGTWLASQVKALQPAQQ